MMAVLFVLPAIAQALPDSWRNPVTEFWPTLAGGQLTDAIAIAVIRQIVRADQARVQY